MVLLSETTLQCIIHLTACGGAGAIWDALTNTHTSDEALHITVKYRLERYPHFYIVIPSSHPWIYAITRFGTQWGRKVHKNHRKAHCVSITRMLTKIPQVI